MKKKILFSILLISNIIVFAQVGINTTNPSSASVLDVESSSDNVNFGGFLPPRVNTSERDAIPTTASDDGMMVFLIDGTTREVQMWDGVELQWETVYAMPINVAPVASSVNFTGTLTENETLTSSYTYSDSDGDLEGTSTYKWYTASDASGTGSTAISGATSSTYDLVTGDVGNYIAVSVTPVATTGTSPGTEVFSSYQGPIIAAINTPWINEFHYDNAGTDVNEGFEIAGTAGFDLTGWTVVLYNGSNNLNYRTISLSGTIDDEGTGFGAVSFATNMQNGSPDGLALIDDTGIVIQFLSYEGTIIAAGGPASGSTSSDIGFNETSSTTVGFSLQLTGTGSVYNDFTWNAPTTSSMGTINTGQTIN